MKRKPRNRAADAREGTDRLPWRSAEGADGPRRCLLFAGFVFVVALAARAAHLLALRSTPWIDLTLGDATTYDAWARQIAGGDWMSGAEVFYQAPLYPYFLALLYRIVGTSPLVVRGVQAIVGSMSCALLADAGSVLIATGASPERSRRAGLVAGLILALYPPAIFHDLLLQKSVLDLFFMCAALSVLSRILMSSWNPRLWFGLGLSIGCLTLTRENAIVLLLPIVAWMVFGGGVRPTATPIAPKSIAAIALAAGLACPLVPVAARNWVVSHELHLTTSQFGPNFYIGNNPHSDGTYRPLVARRARAVYERADATRLAEQSAGRPLSAGEVSSYYADLAMEYIRTHPREWLQLEWRKFLLAWNAVEVADTEDQYAHADFSPVLRWLGVLMHLGVLAPVAVAGICITWPMRRRIWPLHAMVLIYLATLLVFYVFARYRLPMVPLLALFAAGGLTGIGAFVSKERRNSIAICAALVCLTAIVSNWPLLSMDLMRGVTYFNTGVVLQQAGQPDAALANLERAVQLEPRFTEAHNNLGRLLASLGRIDESRRSYERALALDPAFGLAHRNLANLLLAQGALDGAREHFERAIEIDPNDAAAENSLGVALSRGGHVDQAAVHFERALAINPDHAEAHNNLGLVMARRDRMDEAIAHFERALALGPPTVRTHINLGVAYARRGDLDRAAAQFERALAIDPSSAEARADLAKVRRR